MISNASMIRMGKVLGNKMIDVSASNKKLVERSVRLSSEIINEYSSGDPYFRNWDVYKKVHAIKGKIDQMKKDGFYVPSIVKLTVVMLLFEKSFDQAVTMLEGYEERLDKLLIDTLYEPSARSEYEIQVSKSKDTQSITLRSKPKIDEPNTWKIRISF